MWNRAGLPSNPEAWCGVTDPIEIVVFLIILQMTAQLSHVMVSLTERSLTRSTLTTDRNGILGWQDSWAKGLENRHLAWGARLLVLEFQAPGVPALFFVEPQMIVFIPLKEEQLVPMFLCCWKQPDLQRPSAADCTFLFDLFYSCFPRLLSCSTVSGVGR